MKTLLTGGRVLLDGIGFVDGCPILWEDGTILAVGEACQSFSADIERDATGLTVIPGLVDAHTHGRAGYDFSTATAAQMELMRVDYLRHGVTTVVPTLASDTPQGWHDAIRRVEACGFDAIHLEGRYLNEKKRGAHPAHLLAPLDAAELESFLHQICIPCHISAAFELDTDGSFAECARRYGATMGLAHTMATAEEAKLAFSRGVTTFTHLFNAMPPLHHREGGAVSVALGGDGYGELIVDGLHICPEMVRVAYRCLGSERTILITDSMEATGCPDGDYAVAGQAVTVKDGKALTLDGVLAGSTLDLWDGVKNLMRFADAAPADAIACATRNPARMLGLWSRVGSIEAGKRADLLLLDGDWEPVGVIANGKTVR